MPSLMVTRWVGQNSGPIFRRLWTEVNRIMFACAGVSVVCTAVFRLTMSYCVLDSGVPRGVRGVRTAPGDTLRGVTPEL